MSWEIHNTSLYLPITLRNCPPSNPLSRQNHTYFSNKSVHMTFSSTQNLYTFSFNKYFIEHLLCGSHCPSCYTSQYTSVQDRHNPFPGRIQNNLNYKIQSHETSNCLRLHFVLCPRKDVYIKWLFQNQMNILKIKVSTGSFQFQSFLFTNSVYNLN